MTNICWPKDDKYYTFKDANGKDTGVQGEWKCNPGGGPTLSEFPDDDKFMREPDMEKYALPDEAFGSLMGSLMGISFAAGLVVGEMLF